MLPTKIGSEEREKVEEKLKQFRWKDFDSNHSGTGRSWWAEARRVRKLRNGQTIAISVIAEGYADESKAMSMLLDEVLLIESANREARSR